MRMHLNKFCKMMPEAGDCLQTLVCIHRRIAIPAPHVYIQASIIIQPIRKREKINHAVRIMFDIVFKVKSPRRLMPGMSIAREMWNLCFMESCLSHCRKCAGVKLKSGEDLAADLVIDATGGRSHAIAEFLHSRCGQKVEVVKHHVDLSYHTRFFRIPDKVIICSHTAVDAVPQHFGIVVA